MHSDVESSRRCAVENLLSLSEYVCRCSIYAALVLFAIAPPASAEKGKLRERLTPDVMAVVYPSAEQLGPEEGSPPAITVYKSGKPVAYVFSTLDIIAGVRSKIDAMKGQRLLPEQLNISALSDQSIFVRGAIKGVVRESSAAGMIAGPRARLAY